MVTAAVILALLFWGFILFMTGEEDTPYKVCFVVFISILCPPVILLFLISKFFNDKKEKKIKEDRDAKLKAMGREYINLVDTRNSRYKLWKLIDDEPWRYKNSEEITLLVKYYNRNGGKCLSELLERHNEYCSADLQVIFLTAVDRYNNGEDVFSVKMVEELKRDEKEYQDKKAEYERRFKYF